MCAAFIEQYEILNFAKIIWKINVCLEIRCFKKNLNT